MVNELKQMRTNSVKTMWLIIASMLFVAIFETIYSACVTALYTDDCHQKHISNELDSIFSFTDRFVGYVFWFWPIIRIMWPTVALEDSQRYKAAKQ